MATKRIPEGYHSVTPYLFIRGASDAIAFYVKAFGAKELFRMPMPDGRLGHAELQIGDSRVMLADENLEHGAVSPTTLKGTSIGLAIYVEDCDAVYQRAVAAGAKVERAIQNQFYGDRSGTVVDPFGHKWTIASHVEDVSPEEMERRMASMKHG